MLVKSHLFWNVMIVGRLLMPLKTGRTLILKVWRKLLAVLRLKITMDQLMTDIFIKCCQVIFEMFFTYQGLNVSPPNKQKPVKNTRLFGLFHTSDPSLSRDNSRVVEGIVDDLNTGLGPSFYTAKT